MNKKVSGRVRVSEWLVLLLPNSSRGGVVFLVNSSMTIWYWDLLTTARAQKNLRKKGMSKTNIK